ncbi:hypothetical protein [Herbiconiux sp.]|uniref:hypothetical protein n=1 Tax=Herbiconiux sp. TaxID=1871186 RepID=UPI0025BA754E|nr:hypothetical protein [Herbiconiux sp.]
MHRPEELPVALQSAAFSVREGEAGGLTRKRMRAADLQRPYFGVRRWGCDDGDVLERCRAYAPLLRAGDVFSHATAALLWGAPLPMRLEADATLHVMAIDGATRPRSAGVSGHTAGDRAIRVRSRHSLPVVDPVSAWLQLAPLIGLDDLVAMGDYLVLTPRRQKRQDPRPYTSRAELESRLRAFRGRGKRNAVEALQLIRDGAESPRETRLRLRLVRNGLPEPELNVEIKDERGLRIGFGDLVYSSHKVLVEYEGEQHRTDSTQFYRDIERHERLARAQWILIRESKETPLTGPRSTCARTRHALLSRGARL